jgi:polar amino acid transport system permease protein
MSFISFMSTVIDIWKTYGGTFLYGLGITLLITLFSLLFSTILGLALGYLNSVPRNKKSNHYLTIRILQWISHEYIDLIRGTPLIVQAMFFLFWGFTNDRARKNEYNTCWCDSNYTECSSISF